MQHYLVDLWYGHSWGRLGSSFGGNSSYIARRVGWVLRVRPVGNTIGLMAMADLVGRQCQNQPDELMLAMGVMCTVEIVGNAGRVMGFTTPSHHVGFAGHCPSTCIKGM
eukprot:15344069-Ditylum_brightwellii.AAC.1